MTVRDLLESRKGELVEADIVRFSGHTFPFDGRMSITYAACSCRNAVDKTEVTV